MSSTRISNINSPLEVNFGAGRNLDAFGRLPVSQQTTQLDLKQLFDEVPLQVNIETIGSGSATHNTTGARTTLNVTGSGDKVVSQTIKRYYYQTAKGQNFYCTFYGFDNEEDNNKILGYYSSSTTSPYTADIDGITLESDGTNLSVNTYRTGTQTATANRSDWDDPLDGSGPSKVVHDFNNNTILYCQFEWLGVGSVQFFVVKNGVYIPFHSFDFTDTTEVYMSSPNQPLRWEISTTGAAGSFTYICSAVNSEGSLNRVGTPFSSNADDNDLQFNTAGTLYAGIGIRLKTTHLDAILELENFEYLAETNDRALWEIRLNPTVTGTFNYTDITNSGAQTSVGNQTGGAAPTVTGGTVLQSGYLQQAGKSIISIDSTIRPGVFVDGTRTEIVLCIKPINAGLDAYVGYNWNE